MTVKVMVGSAFGPLIHTSGFSPAQISGLHAWFDASIAASMLKTGGAQAGNGENVETWVDQSGNGRDAVNTTGSQQPNLNTTGFSSLPALVFTQTNSDHLLSTVSITGTTCTVFFCMSFNEFTSQWRASSLCNSANADFNDARSAILSWRYDVGKQQSFRNGSGLSSKSVAFSETPPVKTIWATKFDGTNNTYYWQGVAQTPVASTDTFTATKWYLSCGQSAANTPNYFLGSSITEALLYDTALSSGDITALFSYLNSKWSAY